MRSPGRPITRYEVGLVVARQFEHDDVAALGRRTHDPAVEKRRAERDGVFREAVRPFRHDDIVAFVQVRLHRGGRNGEGLEQEDPQHHGDQQGEDDGLEDFAGLAGRRRLLAALAGRVGIDLLVRRRRFLNRLDRSVGFRRRKTFLGGGVAIGVVGLLVFAHAIRHPRRVRAVIAHAYNLITTAARLR